MTLEEFKLKQKWYTAFGKFCSNTLCSQDCPVLKAHKQNGKGCFFNFCRMSETGSLKADFQRK